MTEHTPGPWIVSEIYDPEETYANIRAPKAGDELIASVYTKTDARLIAAAPELLKALEIIAAGTVEDGWILVAPQFVQITIAKAKGEVSDLNKGSASA